MDMDKKSVKITWIIITALLVLWVCISVFIEAMPAKLSGAWEINDGEEIIYFYDDNLCVCDGDEMIYHVLSNDTITFDGEAFEYEITDRKNKKMLLDEKY